METFAALGDPTRRHIVEMLSRGERSMGDIARRFPVSAPAISQHLKVLRAARLVQVRVEAQRRIYTLDPAGFGEIDAWLARMRRFWSGRLEALEEELTKADVQAVKPAKGGPIDERLRNRDRRRRSAV